MRRMGMGVCGVGVAVIVGAVAAGGDDKAAPKREKPMEIKRIDAETLIGASLPEVWRAWTTDEGAQAFFAQATNIDLAIGGAYEILFQPDEP